MQLLENLSDRFNSTLYADPTYMQLLGKIFWYRFNQYIVCSSKCMQLLEKLWLWLNITLYAALICMQLLEKHWSMVYHYTECVSYMYAAPEETLKYGLTLHCDQLLEKITFRNSLTLDCVQLLEQTFTLHPRENIQLQYGLITLYICSFWSSHSGVVTTVPIVFSSC